MPDVNRKAHGSLPITVRIDEQTFRTNLSAMPGEKAKQIARVFGLAHAGDVTPFKGSYRLKIRPGERILLTGRSGAGKSLTLRILREELGDKCIDLDAMEIDANTAICDQFEGLDFEQTLRVMGRSGLADVFTLTRRFAELSDGQKDRFRLAKALASSAPIVLADRFCENLDDQTGIMTAYMFGKELARDGRALIAASAREDLSERLQPTQIAKLSFGEKADVELAEVTEMPRPDVPISFERGEYHDFSLHLNQFHYQAGHVAFPQITWVARSGDEVIGALVTALSSLGLGPRSKLLEVPRAIVTGKKALVISRVVVKPEFRGLGIGRELVKTFLDEALPKHVQFVEILAEMALFHPFLRDSGLTIVECNLLSETRRKLRDFCVACGLSAGMGPDEVEAVLEKLPAAQRAELDVEVNRGFQMRGSGGSGRTIASVVQSIFREKSVYGWWYRDGSPIRRKEVTTESLHETILLQEPATGRKAPDQTHAQSIVFDKDKFTKDQAEAWLKDHERDVDGYDETDTQHRWRQYDPDGERFRYRTVEVADGLYLITGFLKSEWTREAVLEETDDLAEGIRGAFGSMAGKTRIAKLLCELIPEHKTYVEAFTGGAAFFWAKEPSEREVLIDTDETVTVPLKWIQGASDKDIATLRKVDWRVTRANLQRAKDGIGAGRCSVHDALCIRWMTYRSGDVKDSISTGREGDDISHRVDRFPALRERLAGVTVVKGIFAESVAKYDSSNTFWYLDPPYPGEWPKGGERKGLDFDIKAFAETARKLKGKVLVSLNDTPEHRKLFSGWCIREIEMRRSLQRGAAFMDTELLIANYPISIPAQWKPGAKRLAASVLVNAPWAETDGLLEKLLGTDGAVRLATEDSDVAQEAAGGWVNAPTFAYFAVTGKQPDEQIMGRRAGAEEKMWRGVGVDKNIPTAALDAIADIPEIATRSCCEGHGEPYFPFVIFRMADKAHDDKAAAVAEALLGASGVHPAFDIGGEGRPRIVAATRIQPGDDGYEAWWTSLAGKIQAAIATARLTENAAAWLTRARSEFAASGRGRGWATLQETEKVARVGVAVLGAGPAPDGAEAEAARLGLTHWALCIRAAQVDLREALTHNSTLADEEPPWNDVDKGKLPRLAFADMGESDKAATWKYPHHWIQDGADTDDDGRLDTGTMFLHRGGLNAAWAAAHGARSGKQAIPAVIAHLAAHRKALDLE